MLRFLSRRLITIPLVLLGLSLITFTVSRLVPGDPVKLAAGPQARPEQIQKLASEFGLDKPLPTQFWIWVQNAAQGNLGTSISSRTRVGLSVSTVLFTGFSSGHDRPPERPGLVPEAGRRLILTVGVAGFEPTAPRSQSECATKLRYTPVCVGKCMRSV